jgi:glycosyltransferase involved in cell wall biosynthesis
MCNSIAVIIDSYSSSQAVWTAYQKHIISISINFNVVLYIEKGVTVDLPSELKSVDLCRYNNLAHLHFQLLKNRSKKIYLPHILLVNKLFLLKLFNTDLYLWLQGVLPEESFLRNKSKIKLRVLSILEFLALKLVSGAVFVSKAMNTHLLQKYSISMDNHVVLPCLSDLQWVPSEKKNKLSFVYVGGASEWQKIDHVIKVFNEIKKSNPTAVLDFISKDQENIKALLNDLADKSVMDSVNIYSINDRSEMEKSLSKYEFGFLFREDIVVNKVSSPIKLCEYISCGIKPIMSNCIGDYSTMIKKNHMGVVLDESDYSHVNQKLSECVVMPIGLSGFYSDYKNSHNTEQLLQKLFSK